MPGPAAAVCECHGMRIVLSPAPLSSHRMLALPLLLLFCLTWLAAGSTGASVMTWMPCCRPSTSTPQTRWVAGGRAGGCTAPGAALAAASSCTCIPPVTLSCL